MQKRVSHTLLLHSHCFLVAHQLIVSYMYQKFVNKLASYVIGRSETATNTDNNNDNNDNTDKSQNDLQTLQRWHKLASLPS